MTRTKRVADSELGMLGRTRGEEIPVAIKLNRKCVMFGCNETATRRNYCSPHYLDMRFGEKEDRTVTIRAHWRGGVWIPESTHIRKVRRLRKKSKTPLTTFRPSDVSPASKCSRCKTAPAGSRSGLCGQCYGKGHRERNPENYKRRARANYLANRDKILARASQYQKDNREAVNAKNRAWDKANRDRKKAGAA